MEENEVEEVLEEKDGEVEEAKWEANSGMIGFVVEEEPPATAAHLKSRSLNLGRRHPPSPPLLPRMENSERSHGAGADVVGPSQSLIDGGVSFKLFGEERESFFLTNIGGVFLRHLLYTYLLSCCAYLVAVRL